MTSIDEFRAGFDEDPGYLDFARFGPIGRAVMEEDTALNALIARSRFGSLAELKAQGQRAHEAVADLTGLPSDHIVSQPNTSQGLMQAAFGVSGDVLASLGEFPDITFALTRTAESTGRVAPRWLETEHGQVTPGMIRDQLTDDIVAVAVSLVDFRTGFVADLDGIRQVIGDRLLIVDAIQGFTVVDAPYQVADVVVAGGQTWVRAGWGTGFLALSDRAIERIAPVLSGFSATDDDDVPLDEVPPPTHGAAAFQISQADPLAQARFATALEGIADVGVPAIAGALAECTTRIIDLADEFAIPVSSSREPGQRAGSVIITPDPDQLTVLTASLHNHGVTATARGGSVRLSPHVTTDEETFTMLRDSFISFASAINP